jgi:hypothetical protein
MVMITNKNLAAAVAVFGFLVTAGSVGGMETAPDSELLRLTAISLAGLALMYVGIQSIKDQA